MSTSTHLYLDEGALASATVRTSDPTTQAVGACAVVRMGTTTLTLMGTARHIATDLRALADRIDPPAPEAFREGVEWRERVRG